MLGMLTLNYDSLVLWKLSLAEKANKAEKLKTLGKTRTKP